MLFVFTDSCDILVTTPMDLDFQPGALSMFSFHYFLGLSGIPFGRILSGVNALYSFILHVALGIMSLGVHFAM